MPNTRECKWTVTVLKDITKYSFNVGKLTDPNRYEIISITDEYGVDGAKIYWFSMDGKKEAQYYPSRKYENQIPGLRDITKHLYKSFRSRLRQDLEPEIARILGAHEFVKKWMGKDIVFTDHYFDELYYLGSADKDGVIALTMRKRCCVLLMSRIQREYVEIEFDYSSDGYLKSVEVRCIDTALKKKVVIIYPNDNAEISNDIVEMSKRLIGHSLGKESKKWPGKRDITI